MASTENFGFLLCGFCNQKVCQPRMLPCLHSFCEKCLQDLIESQADLEDGSPRRQRLVCPGCDSRVAADDPGRPLRARDFPTNLFFVHLLDAIQLKNAKQLCDSCMQRGEDTEATCLCRDCCQVFCYACTEFHLSFKATSSHEIISLSNLDDCNLRNIMCERLCESHSEKMKFFCRDCSIPICSLCSAETHKQCTGFSTLKEVASERRKMGQSLIQDMQMELIDMEHEPQTIQQNINELAEKKNSVCHEIEQLWEELEAMLQEKKLELLKEVNKSCQVEEQRLKSRQKDCESQLKRLNSISMQLSLALKLANDGDFLLVFDDVQKMQSNLVGISTDSDFSLELRVNEEYQKCFCRLLELPVATIDPLTVSCISQEEDKSEMVDTDNVHSTTDKDLRDLYPFVSEMHPKSVVVQSFLATKSYKIVLNVLFSQGHVVVTDRYAKEIKIFSDLGELQNLKRLCSNPYGLCVAQKDHILITFPNLKQIVYFYQHKQSISQIKVLEVSRQYVSVVAVDQDRIACGSEEDHCIDVLNFPDGNILHTISELFDSVERVLIISNLDFLAAMPNSEILISDYRQNALICSDLTGTVRFVYVGQGENALKNPRGVCVSDSGLIYLADSKRIHCLSLDGDFNYVLLSAADGLRKPCCIHASADGKLLVTELYHRNILIVQIV